MRKTGFQYLIIFLDCLKYLIPLANLHDIEYVISSFL